MNNNVDLIELLAHKRKVCRLHLLEFDHYMDLIRFLSVYNGDIKTTLVRAFHTSNVSDVDSYYVYVGYSDEDLVQTISYDRNNDHAQLGQMFGYPGCCIESFCAHQHITSISDDHDYVYWTPAFNIAKQQELRHHPLMNPDAHALSYFPCRLNCEASIVNATWRSAFNNSEHQDSTFNFNGTPYYFFK